MTAKELKQKFISFFEEKGHKLVSNVSLVPENDPSVLFTAAGMHPLVPYLLGEVHPLGKRLCSVQRCLRTDDIENVGDGFHHTFFEMLGNWSLGNYWKEESLSWSWEFLTKNLNFDEDKIHVSCFAGDSDAPKDEESAVVWRKLGIPNDRIYFLEKKYNWWGPVGNTGPCGPDSEIYIDTGKEKCGSDCDVRCACGKYVEVWNNVFMQYNKAAEGVYGPLKQKNVDTGMGVERVTALTSGFGDDDYGAEMFAPLKNEITKSLKSFGPMEEKRIRIFLDHSRAAIFLIADDVLPGNKDREYVLRRLIRRADDQLDILKLDKSKIWQRAVDFYCEFYSDDYTKLRNRSNICRILFEELQKYNKAILKCLAGVSGGDTNECKEISASEAFKLCSSHGLSKDQLKERGFMFDEKEFEEEKKRHQEISREGVEKKFAGGLVDDSEISKKYHTATHLLHKALRTILGDAVHQAGSNITAERMRFDFTFPEKLTDAQMEQAEDMVNAEIERNSPVKMDLMSLEEAKKSGALAFFADKYEDKVKVYSVGDYSKEVCGGPHVQFTGEIGKIKLIKEEAVGSGRRRIYAKLAQNGD